MSRASARAPKASPADRLLAGVLAVVTAALGLAEWLGSPPLFKAFFLVIGVSPWAWNWWQEIGFVLIAVVWLALVYISAAGYQKAAGRGRLWRVFGLVTLAEILVPLVSVGVWLLLTQIR